MTHIIWPWDTPFLPLWPLIGALIVVSSAAGLIYGSKKYGGD